MLGSGVRYDFSGKNDSEVTEANAYKLPLREFNAACDFLRSDTIGADYELQTPFGRRKLLYADWTASGRSLRFIESYIQEEVLPLYGNTHTLSNATGSRSTFFRMESRQIIKQYFNANHNDALIFSGSGSTASMVKFIQIMNNSAWAIAEAGSPVRDNFFGEDRWGSCECTLCHIRIKNEHLYRAHQHTDGHKMRLQKHMEAQEQGSVKTATGNTPGAPTAAAAKQAAAIQRLVVFIVDPAAHHSLLLAFREMARRPPMFIPDAGVVVSYDVVQLGFDTCRARFAESQLEEALQHCKILHAKGLSLAESFSAIRDTTDDAELLPSLEVVPVAILSAGSNVTGLQNDVARITEMVHSLNGIVCWDFAAVAGHTRIDFNPPHAPQAAIDVGFFSPHKLLGGPGAPGILLIKKRLIRNKVPSVPGGGVVFFVSPTTQTYLQNTEEREEGGTPDILADIRAGLVYRLHAQFSPEHIAEKEFSFVQYLARNWSKNRRIQILGPREHERSDSNNSHLQAPMGIISFVIKYGNNLRTGATNGPAQVSIRTEQAGGLYLHHNFVTVLLNDLFGIQVRGGCACAGPLAQFLLNLSIQQTKDFEACLERTGQEILRPGFVRASVHYSMTWDDIELLCQAVLWVADFGWQFLPFYTFIPETGEWEHRVMKPTASRKWLSSLALRALKGRGIVAVRDGLSKSLSADPNETSGAVSSGPKKDPRRVAGAVSLLGTDPGDLKNNLKAAITGLKKSSTTIRPAVGKEKMVESELESVIRRRNELRNAQPKFSSTGTSACDDVIAQSRHSTVSRESSAEWTASGSKAGASSPMSAASPKGDVGARQRLLSVKETSKPLDELRRAFLEREKTRRGSDVTSANTPVRSEDGSFHRLNTAEDALAAAAIAVTNARSALELNKPPVIGRVTHKAKTMKEGSSALRNELIPEDPADSGDSQIAGSSLDTEGLKGNNKINAPSNTSSLESLFISEKVPSDMEELMKLNHELLQTLYDGPRRHILMQIPPIPPLPAAFIHLLWFALPQDAAFSLSKGETPLISDAPNPLISLDGHPQQQKVHRPQDSCFEPRNFAMAASGIVSGGADAAVIDEWVRFVATGDNNDAVEQADGDYAREPLNLATVLRAELHALRRSALALSGDQRLESSRSPDQLASNLTSNETTDGHESDPASTASGGSIPLARDGSFIVPRMLRRYAGNAIRDFGMIKAGDRVLVGLSGGKDSLTLLHVLRDCQRRSPIKFDLAAATVDPQSPEYDPRPLIPYLKSLGIEYHFLSFPLMEIAKEHMVKNSICSFCSRMRRGILYTCMRKNNYNVLALGQHLDDVCESFVMSAFHNGMLNTMKANYTVQAGDLRVCRPLVYVRERMLADFAAKAKLPVIPDNCPACFSQPKERHRVKLLLAHQEFEFPHVFGNLLQTIRPLLAKADCIDDLPANRALVANRSKSEDPLERLAARLMNGGDAETADAAAEAMLTPCGVDGAACGRVVKKTLRKGVSLGKESSSKPSLETLRRTETTAVIPSLHAIKLAAAIMPPWRDGLQQLNVYLWHFTHAERKLMGLIGGVGTLMNDDSRKILKPYPESFSLLDFERWEKKQGHAEARRHIKVRKENEAALQRMAEAPDVAVVDVENNIVI